MDSPGFDVEAHSGALPSTGSDGDFEFIWMMVDTES